MHLPAGPKIAFGGGVECNDHARIWAVLDKVLAKHPDMVLMHGGSPRGAEKIAACWAAARKVTDIPFKPNWTGEGKAAPFKRNDRMLDVLPIGLVVFPGSGITDNLADKAQKLGVPVSQISENIPIREMRRRRFQLHPAVRGTVGWYSHAQAKGLGRAPTDLHERLANY